MGAEAVLILVDGPAKLPALSLHEPTWYALSYFLREVGTLQGSMGELVSLVRSVKTPEAQLEMVNRFQPALDRLSQDDLDRAAVVTRLMSSHEAQMQLLIRSPMTLIQSADEMGQSFDNVTKTMCCGSMQHIKLGRPHTDCLLSDNGRAEVAGYLGSTIQALLKLT